MSQAIQFLVNYGVVALFVSILIEQAGIPVSSAPLLLAVGSLASLGRINLTMAICAAVAACLIADSVWYQVGRLRRSNMLRKGEETPRRPQSRRRIGMVASSCRWLGVLFLAKFLPGPNLASPLAGISGLTRAHFLVSDAIASVIWACGYITVGYIFKGEFLRLTANSSRIGLLPVFAAIAVAAVVMIRFTWRRHFPRRRGTAAPAPAGVAAAVLAED